MWVDWIRPRSRGRGAFFGLFFFTAISLIPTHANAQGAISKLVDFLGKGYQRVVFSLERGHDYELLVLRRIQTEIKAVPGLETAASAGSLDEFATAILKLDTHALNQVDEIVTRLPEMNYLLKRMDDFSPVLAKQLLRDEKVPPEFSWQELNREKPEIAQELRRIMDEGFFAEDKIRTLNQKLDGMKARGDNVLIPERRLFVNPLSISGYQSRRAAEDYYETFMSYVIRKDGKPVAEFFKDSTIPKGIQRAVFDKLARDFGPRADVQGKENMREAFAESKFLPSDLRAVMKSGIKEKGYPGAQASKFLDRPRQEAIADQLKAGITTPMVEDHLVTDQMMATYFNIVYRGKNVREAIAKRPAIGMPLRGLAKIEDKVPGVNRLIAGGDRLASNVLTSGASFAIKLPNWKRLPSVVNMPRNYRGAMMATPEYSWVTTEFQFEWTLEMAAGFFMLWLANHLDKDALPISERPLQFGVDVLCVFMVDTALVYFLSPRFHYWDLKGQFAMKPVEFKNPVLDATLGASLRWNKSLPDTPLGGNWKDFTAVQRVGSYFQKGALFAATGLVSGAAANFTVRHAADMAEFFGVNPGQEAEMPGDIKMGLAWSTFMSSYTSGFNVFGIEGPFTLGSMPLLATSTTRYSIAGFLNSKIAKFFKSKLVGDLTSNPAVQNIAVTALRIPVWKKLTYNTLDAGSRYGIRFGNNFLGNKLWVMHEKAWDIVAKKPGAEDVPQFIEYDYIHDGEHFKLRLPEEPILGAWEKGMNGK